MRNWNVKPYYERDNIKIFNADCREVLPSIEAGTVDITVTSPPYNQKLDSFKASGFKAEGSAQWALRAASSYFDSLPEGEYQAQQKEVLNAIYGVTASGGSLFYNHKCRWRDKVLLHPMDIVRGTVWSIRQEIIWSRDGSLTQNAKMFPPSEERIIWCFRDSWKWNPEANRWMSVWKITSEKMSEHPVAYPLEIPLRAIEAATDSGDTVLDPYSGSGTTLLAAWNLGRQALGIEMREDYCEIAAKRLDASISQGRLFKPAPVIETQKEMFADAEP